MIGFDDPSDAEVGADTELQAWAAEIVARDGRGFPQVRARIEARGAAEGWEAVHAELARIQVEVDHPARGKYLTVGNPIKLSDSPSDVVRSPLLGEHTTEILRDLLGLSQAEIEALEADGVLT